MSGDSPALGPGKRRAFGCIGLLLGWLLLEIVVQVVWLVRFPEFQMLRDAMLGRTRGTARELNAIDQPYLCYVPAPGYANRSGVQHNEQGYRGQPVPLRRTPGTLRILCLGGSTTYGWGVPDWRQAWPERLREHLAEQLPAGYTGVEVINGGLPQGTSAEMLTHYLFKFHYFRPDLVILEAGGNDALATAGPVYQPDYSHWRRHLHNIEPLPRQSRWLMHSRVLSTLVIVLFRYEYISPDSHSWPEGTLPAARWYPDLDARQGGRRPIPDDELAFEHNMETLIAQCRGDGAKVLLMPFRLRSKSGMTPAVADGIAHCEQLLRGLAQRYGLPLAPNPESNISPENWADDCHLKAPGQEQKARHVESYVRALLAQRPEKDSRAGR